MIMKQRFILMICCVLSAVCGLHAQQLSGGTVPLDPAVKVGVLPNGLTYYIRHNEWPEKRADFYIAQKVGSMQEEESQRGLAHFLEHMCFNGTTHFPGDALKQYLERIGVKFGENLNAYTSFDETVYNINNVNVEIPGALDSCLLILHDWSHDLLLDGKEIDEERGVINEEWRLRRSAMMRMQERAFHKLYEGSRYADRMPIGTMEVVMNFPYEAIRSYYRRWYRPDLQGIVIVGDVNVDEMEQKIKQMFADIQPAAADAPVREYFPVADNKEPLIAIEKDKEQPIILGHLYMKSETTPDSEKNSVKYQREDYISGLITYMLNGRLSEKKQVANPPFMSSTVKNGEFFVSRTKDAFSLSISCKQDNVLGGISVAVGEVERARQHGFTASELERAKKLYLNAAERQLKMEKDYKNSHYVSLCVNNFLEGEPILTPAYNLQLIKQFDGEVNLDEVNKQVGEIITDKNQVFIMYGPDKEGFVIPSESEIESTVLAAQQKQYDAYQEEEEAIL